MNRFVLPLAIAIAAATPAGAQEVKPIIRLLGPGNPVVAEQDPAPAGSFEALEKAVRDAQQIWMKGYSAARAEGEAAAAAYLRDTERVEEEFAPKFAAAAKEHAGTEAAVPFLNWLCSNDPEHLEQHAFTLLEDHADSPELAKTVQAMRYGAYSIGRDKAVGLLTLAIERTPHENVRLAALHVRGTLRMQADGDAELAAAKADLQTVIDSDDEALSARARGDLFELENLQIGMTAPDIEGEDLDGVPFRLSDYRGKVVVLDFWGDW